MTSRSTASARNEAPETSAKTEPLIGAAEIAFIRCIERLEELLDGETETLKCCVSVDFEALNLRKTHALLEFTRVARAMPTRISSLAEERLSRLRKKLATNAEILEQHVQAMLEITGIVVESIQSEDSDGTYSVRRSSRK
jgi:hypothetical protein